MLSAIQPNVDGFCVNHLILTGILLLTDRKFQFWNISSDSIFIGVLNECLTGPSNVLLIPRINGD